MYHFPPGMPGLVFPPGDTVNVSQTIEHCRYNGIRTAEQLRPWVGGHVTRRDLVGLLMYARDERWQALGAATLLLLDDATAGELEAIVRFLGDPQPLRWRDLAPWRPLRTVRNLRRHLELTDYDFNGLRQYAFIRLINLDAPCEVFDRIARYGPEPWATRARDHLNN